MRTRNARGEGLRLREEIRRAAADLLDETGDQQAVTLRAVARRVGIAAPSIYPHFPDPQAIVLAVVQETFAEFTAQLRTALDGAGPDPVAALFAVGTAYLDFAAARPRRYRVMFGGVWNARAAVEVSTVSDADVAALGRDALALLTACVAGCAAAGRSTSTDPAGDAVALWVGLHGLAHQRAVASAFAWPPDIADRIIARLACLGPGRRPDQGLTAG